MQNILKVNKLVWGLLIVAVLVLTGCAESSAPSHEDMVNYNGEWIPREEYIQIKSGNEESGNTTVTDPTTTPTPALGYSRNNPAPIGTTLSTEFNLIADTYIVEITLVEIIRGEEAWDIVSDANMFNDPPESSYEYVLVKIRFHYMSCVPPEDTEFDWYYFEAVSSQGQTFDEPFVVAPDPQLTPVYPGATTEGWEVLLVKVDDLAPLLTFGTEGDSDTSRVWFQLY